MEWDNYIVITNKVDNLSIKWSPQFWGKVGYLWNSLIMRTTI
jgi:hypothetical protein